MKNILPIFTSEYSISKSLLTLEDEAELRAGNIEHLARIGPVADHVPEAKDPLDPHLLDVLVDEGERLEVRVDVRDDGVHGRFRTGERPPGVRRIPRLSRAGRRPRTEQRRLRPPGGGVSIAKTGKSHE